MDAQQRTKRGRRCLRRVARRLEGRLSGRVYEPAIVPLEVNGDLGDWALPVPSHDEVGLSRTRAFDVRLVIPVHGQRDVGNLFDPA